MKIITIFLLILDLEDSHRRREPSDQLWSTYLLALDLATALEWGLLCWRPRLRSYRSWRNTPLSGHPTLRYVNKFLYLSLKVCTKSSRSCTLYMTLYSMCTCMDAGSHQLRCITIIIMLISCRCRLNWRLDSLWLPWVVQFTSKWLVVHS